jgi:hypothetical protein
MLSVAPAMAQDARFTGLDAPRGATATVNFRVPLGASPQQADRQMSYGLTLSYGQPVGAMLDGRPMTRAINLADLRFDTGGELRNARVASFDLANLDQDRRFDGLAAGGGKKSLLLIGALIGAGIAVCVLADCFDGSNDEESESPGQTG